MDHRYIRGKPNLFQYYHFLHFFKDQPWILKRILPVAAAVLVALTKIEAIEERPKKAVSVPALVTQIHQENSKMKFTQRFARIIIQVIYILYF